MKEPLENIDHLSQKMFSDWEMQPPPGMQEKIGKRMLWFNLWKNARSRYLLLALLLVTLSGTSAAVYLNWSVPQARQTSDLRSVSNQRTLPASQTAEAAALNASLTQNGNQSVNQPAAADFRNSSTKNANTTSNANTPESRTASSGHTPAATTPNTIQSASSNILTTDPLAQSRKDAVSANMSTKEKSFTEQVTNDLVSSRSISQIEKVLMKNSVTTPVPDVTEAASNPRKRRFYHPVFDLSLEASALFGSTGETRSNYVNIKQGEPSGTVALLLHYNGKCWFAETGIQYTLLQSNHSTDGAVYNVRTDSMSYISGNYTTYDTSYYMHYFYIHDSVIRILDSVWTMNLDSTLNNIYSDSLRTMADTLYSTKWSSQISLIEIPFAVGCKVYSGPFEFSLKAGVLMGISTRLNGKTFIANSSMGLVELSETYNTKQLQWSWFASANMAYVFSERWAVLVTPSYRSSINGFKSFDGSAKRYYHAWGVGLGLRYEF
jgi:hypothetical protein